MRPSSRLDLLLVPDAPDAPLALGEALAGSLRADAVFGDGGCAGPAAGALVPGGFRGWRLDRPERLTLYANRQGGFGVRCPVTGASIVSAFVVAWGAARERGALPSVSCPSCRGDHATAALVFRPAAAFARWAIEVSGVDGSALAGDAAARWPALAKMVTVLRRG